MTFNVVKLADHRKAQGEIGRYVEATLADLRKSGLFEADAMCMQLVELSEHDVAALTNGAFRCTGYKIPYFDRDGNPIDFYRIRFHRAQWNSKTKKKQRYWQPPGVGIAIYLPPCVKWDIAYRDRTEPGFVTEGEKKAFKACRKKMLTIGLGGVDSFASKPAGIELHPDVRDFVSKRAITIVYDADLRTKPGVARASKTLASLALAAKANSVGFVDLPTGYDLDTYLAEHDAADLKDEDLRLFDVKAQLALIREQTKMPARERHERMRDLMLADMDQHGSFHYEPRGDAKLLYWFDKRVRKLYSLDRLDDRDTVARLAAIYGISGAEGEWRWLHDALANHCVTNGRKSRIHTLVHGKGRSKLYLFNGKRVYLIRPDGHEEIRNGTDGVVFRNPSMVRVKLKSARRSAMDEIVETPRFVDTPHVDADEFQMLFECWLWATLFPHLMPTRPILLLRGPKGGRKTSGLRRYLWTLYGSQANVSIIDRDKLDGVIAALSQEHIVVLDNIDGTVRGLEDLLAVAATGGDKILRELFKTNQLHKAPLRAFVAATSREPKVFRRDDVADRLLPLSVERSADFKSEAAIKSVAIKARGNWWAYALETLPGILKALRDYTPEKHKYRMADFADFCLAIGPAVGYKRSAVRNALDGIEAERGAFSLETSTLPDALRAALVEGEINDVTAKQLLDTLQEANRDGSFYFKSARSLGSALNNQIQALLAEGIKVQARLDGKTKIFRYTVSEAK